MSEKEQSHSAITRKPSRFGTMLALVFALVSVFATALASTLGAGTGVAGLVALAAGLATGSRRSVGIGGTLLLGAVLVAGYTGGGPEPLLVGALTGVLAFDAAGNALTMGEQLGRESSTARAELVHSAASLGFGATATVVGYGVFAAAGGGQPLTALLLLVGGAVALVSGLR